MHTQAREWMQKSARRKPATQTLSGNGSAIGNFVVVGTLSPGDSIGQLTITGNLTLSGTSAMELDRNGAPLTADNANVSGTLTYGGTLSLTSTPGVGSTFTLLLPSGVADGAAPAHVNGKHVPPSMTAVSMS